MPAVQKMFIYVRPFYKIAMATVIIVGLSLLVLFAKEKYSNVDFGDSFEKKSKLAILKLDELALNFDLCSSLCNVDPVFMQSIVFPEIMRYNSLRDDVETESLRTLYVQLGEEYADFSIGIFQMKPSFAAQVETKSKQMLPAALQQELVLTYETTDLTTIRKIRVERLQDQEWQLIYLTAFVSICNKLYSQHNFTSDIEKLQWYATIYNAGFDKSTTYIKEKIARHHFYLSQDMPGKKFQYAALASWYYNKSSP